MKWSRRAFIAAGGAALAGGGLAAWGHWFETEWLEVTRTRIRIFPGPVPRPLRVLHLSDLHFSRVVPLSLIRRAIELGLEQKPDLAVLTGDFITGGWTNPAAVVDFAQVLQALSAHVETLACLGNHDTQTHPGRPLWRDSSTVRNLLHMAQIRLLDNESLVYVREGARLEIIGVGDLWMGDCRPEQAFPTNDAGLPRLVMAHNPDSKDRMGHLRWDCMVCGHSHGGQLRLPLLGSPLAPIRDKRYAVGLNPWRGRQIFTTRGVGNLMGFRLFCRPEVSLLELT